MTTGLTGDQLESGVVPTHEAYVRLTNAQVKALPTTSVVVVPAVAGRIYLPIFAIVRVNLAADYTNVDNAVIVAVSYNGGTSGVVVGSWENAWGQNLLTGGDPNDPVSGYTGMSQLSGGPYTEGKSGYYDSDWVNKPLRIGATNNGMGDFTGGDTANFMDVTIHYLQFDVA